MDYKNITECLSIHAILVVCILCTLSLSSRVISRSTEWGDRSRGALVEGTFDCAPEDPTGDRGGVITESAM